MRSHLLAKVFRAVKLLPTLLCNAFSNIVSRASITGSGECVVSLTTYSTRTRYVFLTIESIARGTLKPGRVILWIDDRSILESLPSTLTRLQQRGLEIRQTQNYGPHKKYYPYVCSEDKFSVPLVTADDDIIYPPFWLEGLLSSYRQYPDNVSCYRAHSISISAAGIAPYRQWTPCSDTTPRYGNFSTGASGALYPPGMLRALKLQGTAFLESAPRADDVWLHASALRNGFKTRQVRPSAIEFPVIPGTQGLALSRQNVALDGNDTQIQLTYDIRDIDLLCAESTT